MGFEEIYNTKLTLSLGSHHEHEHKHDHAHHHKNKRSKPSPESYNYSLPSLSLGLNERNNDDVVVSPTFSDSSLKRERDQFSGEDLEVEVDEIEKLRDDNSEVNGTRKKLRLTKQQSLVLEDSFKEHTTLNSKQKQDLARKLNLRPRQVEVWFQNRRARTKLKQTEVEYEVLRKCYETLRDENRRLQKELQDLKSSTNINQTTPFHMAATLSMCPSCERTHGGSGDSSATKFSLSATVAAGNKSHFYPSFLNPSAACLS